MEMFLQKLKLGIVSKTIIRNISLIFVLQLVCLAGVSLYENTKFNDLTNTFGWGSFIVPFIGYVAVLYKVPAFAMMPGILKMICLTLLSLAATFGGAMFVIVVLASAGVPMRY